MGGLTVTKLSAIVVGALAFALCTAPAAHAFKCGGDPVYDPGVEDKCNFTLALAMPGAEATVHGRWYDRQPIIDASSSYVKDTADDGMDAYLWVRYVKGRETRDERVGRASGPGATASVRTALDANVDSFSMRVCVGEGTANCSDWRL